LARRFNLRNYPRRAPLSGPDGQNSSADDCTGRPI
jgi:hypothetical protein